MWLNQLFTDESVDYERRCWMRIKIGVGVMLLGMLAIGMSILFQDELPIFYREEGAGAFIPQFYLCLGLGLVIGGIIKARQNMRVLKDPVLRKREEVAETDERNRLLGLRCWAYAGYSMFLALYVGVLISGFISETVVRTLMVVTAVYALLLMIFRHMLNRSM